MSNWYPAEDPKQPYYPRTIKVLDLAYAKLTGTRLGFWQKCRDAGLALWKAGMDFRVSNAFVGYKPGFITLDITPTQDHTGGQADFGRLPPDSTIAAPGVAWAHFDPYEFDRQFLSGTSKDMTRIVGHEVGHCLGFGHGGTGLMTYEHQGNVNDEELAALKAYWKT